MWQELLAKIDQVLLYIACIGLNETFQMEIFSMLTFILPARQEKIDDIAKAMAFSIESDILRKEGDIQGSITALESAVTLNPNQPTYWNTLGHRRLLLIDKNDPEILLSKKLSMLNQSEQEISNAISLGDYARPTKTLQLPT